MIWIVLGVIGVVIGVIALGRYLFGRWLRRLFREIAGW